MRYLGTQALPGILALVLAVTLPQASLAAGTLVIAGGAVRADNTAVFGAFAAALPPEGPVVIIPAASGQPSRAAKGTADSLRVAGIDMARLVVYPVALRNDSATSDVDERDWQRNAWDSNRVNGLRNAAGFWFTGGDQMRIAQLLRDENGGESPLLQLVRDRLAAGAVVGGTSAGAAIMSRHMISGGDSFTALVEPRPVRYETIEEQESGHISTASGLGFLESGLVDQHFDRKARLGRLVRAMDLTGSTMGYGVDEDTALVVDTASGQGSVVGSGTVVVLDARQATFDWQGPQLASGLRLSLFPAGSTFSTTSGEGLHTPGEPTQGQEYFGHAVRAGGGMTFPNQTLEQMLGNDLIDNRATTVLERWSADDRGRVLIYRFRQTGSSRGYWDERDGANRYTITDTEFSILRGTLPNPVD